MLAAEMKRSIQDLFVEFLRDNGFSVDYAGEISTNQISAFYCAQFDRYTKLREISNLIG